MTHTDMCKHCQQLMSSRPHPTPKTFSEVNRIYNHTLYQCKSCGAYFGHVHVPYRWQLMLAPTKQHVPTPVHARPSRPRVTPSIHF